MGYPEGDTDTKPMMIFCARKKTAAALDHYLHEHGFDSLLLSSHLPPQVRKICKDFM